MNRRELISTAIAAAIVPDELVIEPAPSIWGPGPYPVIYGTPPLPTPGDYSAFVETMIRRIAAAMEIPYAQLSRELDGLR